MPISDKKISRILLKTLRKYFPKIDTLQWAQEESTKHIETSVERTYFRARWVNNNP